MIRPRTDEPKYGQHMSFFSVFLCLRPILVNKFEAEACHFDSIISKTVYIYIYIYIYSYNYIYKVIIYNYTICTCIF